MEKLIKMALMMLAEMRVAQRVSRFSGAAKWMLLAGLCGIASVVALIAALWLFLIPRIGSDAAALAMGVLLAALSGLFALIARATLHPNRGDSIAQDDDGLPDLKDLKDLFVKHKGTVILSAVLAGLAMGNGKK